VHRIRVDAPAATFLDHVDAHRRTPFALGIATTLLTMGPDGGESRPG
jgi:hypothetical protein